jgi:hypothetical protein
MTAEVEALLERLDGMNWPECIAAAALIRGQAEEIARLHDNEEHRKKVIAENERLIISNIQLREQIAAATRQEPVAWMNKEGSVISREARDFPMDCLVVPLYSAPIPAGDAVSVERNLHKDCAKNGCHAFRVGFRKCDNGECHRK